MLTANLSLTSIAARQADADIAHVFPATVQPPGCMNTTNKKKSPGCEEPGFLSRDWRGSDVGRRGPGEGREGSRKEISPEDRSGLRNLLPPVSSAKCGTKRTGDYANGKPNDAHPTNHRLSLQSKGSPSRIKCTPAKCWQISSNSSSAILARRPPPLRQSIEAKGPPMRFRADESRFVPPLPV